MSDQEICAPLEIGSEERTLFDERASLVPEERQAEYYRVIAHTRTLSPPTMRCSGYWKQWVSSRSSREKHPQQ